MRTAEQQDRTQAPPTGQRPPTAADPDVHVRPRNALTWKPVAGGSFQQLNSPGLPDDSADSLSRFLRSVPNTFPHPNSQRMPVLERISK